MQRLYPLGLLVMVAVAGPWFVLMQREFAEFNDYFFIEQHFRRFAQTGFNNVHPFWFYIAVLTGLTSLWVWWGIAVLGFVSLPSSKLVGYIMPALAPWCALLGMVVARGRAWRWVLPASALLCLGIVTDLAWKAPGSHRDVAERLAALQQPGDHVVFIDSAYYDVPFYAQLKTPAIVLSSWDDPSIPQHDNWRKEFADAARFDKPAAAQILWTPDRAKALRCGPGSTWLVADKGYQPPAAMGTASPVFMGANAQLLGLDKICE